jgi:type IV secretion system protein TrbL
MDSGILTTLLNTFEESFTGGYSKIYPDALRLLSILAVLEVAVAAIWWALCDENALVEFLKKIMRIGFFIFVVANYQSLVSSILDGFVTTGLKAGGSSSVSLIKDPSAIVRFGLTVTGPIFAHSANYGVVKAVTNIADLLVTSIAALLIILAFFALAIQVFITYLEFFIISVLGLILVPFGTCRYTAFLAEKVFGAIISFGVRLMVLAFILAAATPTLSSLSPPPDPNIQQVLLLLLTALTIAGLAWHAPAVAAGLISGSPTLTAGTVAGTGVSAGAALVSATMAARGGAATIVSATRAASAFGKGGDWGGGGGADPGSSSANPHKSSTPHWAYDLSLARQSIPTDSHPKGGMAVPLKPDT